MKSIIGKDFFIKNGAIFAILGILVYVGLYTGNWIAALFAALGYFGGESFGWAKWHQALREWGNESFQDKYNKEILPRRTGHENGIHWIASRFFKESSNFTQYGQLALVLRGMWWFIPVYVPLVVLGVVSIPVAAIAVVALGILFPLTYWVFVPHHPRGPFGGKLGFAGGEEKMYGVVYGAIIAWSLYANGGTNFVGF
jgi:hypothetical protein